MTALKQFHSHMGESVLFEFILRLESRRALRTFERFFSSMDQFVLAKRRFRSERFLTKATTLRLFSQVD
jgi:hypothetical protein